MKELTKEKKDDLLQYMLDNMFCKPTKSRIDIMEVAIEYSFSKDPLIKNRFIDEFTSIHPFIGYYCYIYEVICLGNQTTSDLRDARKKIYNIDINLIRFENTLYKKGYLTSYKYAENMVNKYLEDKITVDALMNSLVEKYAHEHEYVQVNEELNFDELLELKEEL